MTSCKKCGRESPPVARVLGFCAECIKGHYEELEGQLAKAHDRTRAAFGLPGKPPKATSRASTEAHAETQARFGPSGAPPKTTSPVFPEAHADIQAPFGPSGTRPEEAVEPSAGSPAGALEPSGGSLAGAQGTAAHYTTCNFCVNECDVASGESGYCGVRFNAGGVLVGGTSWANVSWYHDPLPTNCVANWVCAAGSAACHPEYCHAPEAEPGFYNLAVFYQACSFDCLFCQNWHFRQVARALEDGIVTDRSGSRAAGADGGGGHSSGQPDDRTGDCRGADGTVRHGADSAAGDPLRRPDVFRASRNTPPKGGVTPAELAAAADERTACICYFGGDPAPQMVHSILTARRATPDGPGRIMRICWETNGSSNPDLLRVATDIALESGGCIKFDLKAWDENLHKALCGVTNSRTLRSFKQTAQYALRVRPEPPPVAASTLLVPGYVDEREVYNIARHIASVDRDIPYSLLAFHPQYCMGDLPTTSAAHASRCLDAAKAAGLTRLRLGNRHLLGADYS